MKRNLIPLLGIAFVVAIAATGVFYGLFVGKISGAPASATQPAGQVVAVVRAMDRGTTLKAADVQIRPISGPAPAGAFFSVEDVIGQTIVVPLNAFDPVTSRTVAGAGAGSGLSIPVGMRAVSIRVADSAGLLPFVRSGHRVDIQAVSQTELAVRTLLSDVEVLNAHVESGNQGPSTTVLNLLIPARDVDRVAQADSLGRVRIALRNPDEPGSTQPLKPAPLSAPVSAPANAPAVVGAAAAHPRMRFEVRIGSARGETIRDLLSRGKPDAAAELQIAALPKDWTAERGLQGLRVLSNRTLEAMHGQEVFHRTGSAEGQDYDLRVHLTPRSLLHGVLRVRVRPEMTIPQRGGLSSRRLTADLDLAEGQSVLVAGFEREVGIAPLAGKLFRNSGEPEGELFVVVTPRSLPAK